jgi:two-component system, cell cycle sensor histidine kinase and response regulator CckA
MSIQCGVRAERDMPSSRAILEREVRAGSETILLVEDEAFVREVTGEVLESAGYVVLKAGNAEQALKAQQRFPGVIHLLVTDLCMPGKNGRALAAELGSLRPAMKTILVSGYGESLWEKDGNPGVVYFPKPFSAVSLMSKIREVLDDYHETADRATNPARGEVLATTR